MACGCDGFGARLLKCMRGCVCFKIATVEKSLVSSYSYYRQYTQQTAANSTQQPPFLAKEKKKGGTSRRSHGKQGRIPKSSLPPTSCGGLPPITASRILIGCRAINAATRQPPRSKQGSKRPAGSALRGTNQSAWFAVAIRDIEQARRQGRLKGGSGRGDSIWACKFFFCLWYLAGSGGNTHSGSSSSKKRPEARKSDASER